MSKKRSSKRITLFLSVFSIFSFIKTMEWPQPPQKTHASAPMPAKTREQLRLKQLRAAVHAGNLQEIKRNVDATNVNQPDNHGFTPLFYARTAPVAALLIFNGANTQVHNNYGITPLHQAAALNDLGVVQVLTNPTQAVRFPDQLYVPTVWVGCTGENGYCSNQQYYDQLKEMAKEQELPTNAINRYLSANAARIALPPTITDNHLHTPLWYAVANNAYDVAAYLLERLHTSATMLPLLSEIDSETGRGFMHMATTPTMINLLGQHNFPVNIEDNFGLTPLEMAALHNRDDLVSALIANNALIPGPLNNTRPVSDPRHQAVLAAVLRIYQNANPLLYAMLTGNFNETQRLLTEGRNIQLHATTGFGGFLNRLAGRQQTEATRLLTTPVNDLTPIRAAIGQRSRPLTALLITHGALAHATPAEIAELGRFAQNISAPEVTSLLLAMRTAVDDTVRRQIAQRAVNEYLQKRAPVVDLETAHEPMAQAERDEVGPTQEPVRLNIQHALQHLQAQLPSASSSFGSLPPPPQGFGGQVGGGSQRD